MIIQSQIEHKLKGALNPVHLEVINESGMHNVPPGSETHFKVIAVSEDFEGSTLLSRHRKINELLAEQISGPVHALSLHPMTPKEWQHRGNSTESSPLCRGGSKFG